MRWEGEGRPAKPDAGGHVQRSRITLYSHQTLRYMVLTTTNACQLLKAG